MSSRLAWVACVALVVVGVAAELARPIPADLGFYLYAAGRMLDGARLYRDVVDLNPPLIFVLNLPVVLLARTTGLSEFVLYRLGSALFMGMLLLYSGRLVLRYVLPEEPARARYVVLLLCFVLFVLPRFDFGQREHFVLALLVPYMLLVAAEGSARSVPAGDRVLIGLMTGAAIGFKPYFAVVWVGLEVFRRVSRPVQARWRPTPELAGVLGFLGLYGAAVLLLTPRYLPMALLLGPGYRQYLRKPFLELLVLGPGVPLIAFVLLARLVLRRVIRTPLLAALLAWTTVACFVAGAAQEKEFRYHFFPALGVAFVLLGLVAVDANRTGERLVDRLYGRASRALLATIVAVVLGWAILEAAGGDPAQRRQQARLAELARTVRREARGRPVGVFSFMESAFPLVNYARVGLASRFPSLWPLAAYYWSAIETGGALQYRAISEMAPDERYFVSAVRQDLAAAQPNLLIVLRPARDAPMNGMRRLDYFQYFTRDPQLGTFLAQYRLAGRRGEYLLYERRGADATPARSPAAVASGTQDVVQTRLAEVRLGSLDRESVVGLAVFLACWVALAISDRRRAAA